MNARITGLVLVAVSGLMYAIELTGWRIAYVMEKASPVNPVYDWHPPTFADNWLGWLLFAVGAVLLLVSAGKEINWPE